MFSRDPFVWAGLAFLSILVTQFYNSGRTLVFEPEQGWMYTRTSLAWLPSSIHAHDAFVVMTWFFLAFTVALMARWGGLTRRVIRTILVLLLLNAAIMGLVGSLMLSERGTTDYSFAWFRYFNHASAYFYLHYCLGIGLCFDGLVHRLERRDGVFQSMVAGCCALICLAAANLAGCLAGSILSILATILVVFAVYWRRRISGRIVLRAGGLFLWAGGLLFVVGAVLYAGRDIVLGEFAALFDRSELIYDYETRHWQLQNAMDIFTDYPWFGAGGMSYQYLSALYLPESMWSLVLLPGKANVHHDAVQFLVEYGMIGMGCMLIAFITLLKPFSRVFASRRSFEILFFLITGCIFIILHSMIDLPFRSPPILVSWTCLLSLGGMYAAHGRQGPKTGMT
jgi:hypothetical protein